MEHSQTDFYGPSQTMEALEREQDQVLKDLDRLNSRIKDVLRTAAPKTLPAFHAPAAADSNPVAVPAPPVGP